MTTYRVKPLPKSEQTRSEKWQLQKSGKRIETSYLKSDVVTTAEARAREGDILITESKSGNENRKEIKRTSGGRLL